MLLPVCVNCAWVVICITIETAVAASVVSADVNALDAAAFFALPLVFCGIDRTAGESFQQTPVNAARRGDAKG